MSTSQSKRWYLFRYGASNTTGIRVGGRRLLAHIVIPGMSPIGVSCQLLFMLRCVAPKSWLGSSVDVASYAHSLIDLASDVPGGLVRADGVMSHARDRVANAVYRNTSEHSLLITAGEEQDALRSQCLLVRLERASARCRQPAPRSLRHGQLARHCC